MRQLIDLFVSFFKIGLFTFGGGYAMLPMLQREIVEKHKWATEDDVLDYYAIGQCTPGIIAVNTATFVGVKLAGALGGAVSTVAVVCPSLIIITIISTILRNFAEYAVVQHAFAGIRVAVAALVVVSVVKLFKKGVKDVLGYVIFAVSLLLVFFLDVSPIWVVLAAIAIGVGKALKAGKGGEQA
ncbi:MAG: chromate transporter [Candidatus Avoscillospira sp.]